MLKMSVQTKSTAVTLHSLFPDITIFLHLTDIVITRSAENISSIRVLILPVAESRVNPLLQRPMALYQLQPIIPVDTVTM